MHRLEAPSGAHWEFDGALRLANHSFAPSVAARFDAATTTVALVAVRPLDAGEDVTLDYTQTETAMAEPFVDAATGREVRGKR
mmetsp:Transcript_10842/g.43901  ORF Transcript_10842/g.43901 Transcript_10842/m.43901 type:complete len:83 (-) Transcript_10842:171-419(-)